MGFIHRIGEGQGVSAASSGLATASVRRFGWIRVVAVSATMWVVAAACGGSEGTTVTTMAENEPPQTTIAQSTTIAPDQASELERLLAGSLDVSRSVELEASYEDPAGYSVWVRGVFGMSDASTYIADSDPGYAALDVDLGFAAEVTNETDGRNMDVIHPPQITLYFGATESALGAFGCAEHEQLGVLCGLGHGVSLGQLLDGYEELGSLESVRYGPVVSSYGPGGAFSERSEGEIEQIARIFNDGALFYEVRIGTEGGGVGLVFDADGNEIERCSGISTGLVPALHSPCH